MPLAAPYHHAILPLRSSNSEFETHRDSLSTPDLRLAEKQDAPTEGPSEPTQANITVCVAFESRLDSEAYAARISAEKGFSATPSEPHPNTEDAPCVTLADHCCGIAARGVVLVDTSSPKGSPCSCCRRLSKACEWDTLLDALAQTAGRGSVRTESLEAEAPPSDFIREEAQKIATLTRREMEVLKLVGQGMTVRQTAARLGVAESTIGNHKYRLMRKLGVKTSLEALRIAVRHGLANI